MHWNTQVFKGRWTSLHPNTWIYSSVFSLASPRQKSLLLWKLIFSPAKVSKAHSTNFRFLACLMSSSKNRIVSSTYSSELTVLHQPNVAQLPLFDCPLLPLKPAMLAYQPLSWTRLVIEGHPALVLSLFGRNFPHYHWPGSPRFLRSLFSLSNHTIEEQNPSFKVCCRNSQFTLS